ncbi:SDR family oxidoreductase [Microbacterium profundi]|uniref:SDR family NAD(P)-dependent oxidoreductase n=1 Tax=Microbacterium profundi TaxID=450380 RepID=UPI001F1EAFBA|nr:SDR family NAD(P)-dependent oxidoreductase [Microbacterium profundi]MCE7482008.1 SDR family oxidoreductase [Microbacterium profundi]
MIGNGLTGKVALVSGTAHGIGAAIAKVLVEEGATVHGVDRLIGDPIDGVTQSVLDVTDAAAVNAFVAELGRVDVLVNCAGGVVGQVHHPIEEITDEQWQAVVDANLTSTFLMTRAVVPGMKQNGWGRIVNISSGAGRSVSLTGIQAYASSKAGQIGLTRQTAHELGQYGITVNNVAPGFVLSNPTSQAQWDSYGPEGQAELVKNIATRRTGSPFDIANGVRYFTSEWASWVSGQTLSIDGGHHMF